MTPSILDTLAFAPAPLEAIDAAARSRPGVRLIETPTSYVRVRVVDPPGRADGADGTVVLLPDGPNTLEHYDALAGRLVDDGRRVALLEIPGFGFSWATDPHALTFDGTAAATAAALEQLDLGPVVLGGVCVQALVALRVAAASPHLVDGLVLVQCTDWDATVRWAGDALDARGALREPWAGQARWRLRRQRLAVETWYPAVAGPAAPVAAWQETATEVLAAPSTYALASMLQEWSGPEPDLRGVTCPAAVLWGEADPSHGLTGSDPRGLLRYVPDARFTALPRVGHFADLEAPEALITAVRDVHARAAG